MQEFEDFEGLVSIWFFWKLMVHQWRSNGEEEKGGINRWRGNVNFEDLREKKEKKGKSYLLQPVTRGGMFSTNYDNHWDS